MDEVKRYKPEWDDLRGKWILPIEMACLDVVLHTDYAKLQAENERLREALENADHVAKALSESARHPFGHDSYHFLMLAQSVKKFTQQALSQPTGGTNG